MLLLDNLRAACSAAKAGRKVMPVKEIPVVELDTWCWTPEACLSFSKPTREYVRTAFHSAPPEVHKQFTRTPERGKWVQRATLWKELLRDLPPKQRNEAMLKILARCVECVREADEL